VPLVRATDAVRLALGVGADVIEDSVARVHAATRADTPGTAKDHRAAVRRKVRRSTDGMLRRRAIERRTPVRYLFRVDRRYCRRRSIRVTPVEIAPTMADRSHASAARQPGGTSSVQIQAE